MVAAADPEVLWVTASAIPLPAAPEPLTSPLASAGTLIMPISEVIASRNAVTADAIS